MSFRTLIAALAATIGALVAMLLGWTASPNAAFAGVAGIRTTEAVMTEPLLPERAPITAYSTYTNQHFNFTASVPAGWAIDDHFTIDSVFGFVIRYSITGPPDSGSHFGFTELEFSMVPTTEVGGTIPDLATYATTSKLEKNVIGGTIVSDVSTSLLGLPAREIEIQFTEKRPPWNVPLFSPQVSVIVRKKWLAFEKDHHFFEINIESTDADWSLYLPAYDTAKNTLAFTP